MADATVILSDRTKWDPDVQVAAMGAAIAHLRGNGFDARLRADPHAWDCISLGFGDMTHEFTPWFFEVEGCNFAVASFDPADEDEDPTCDNRKVSFDSGAELGAVIVGWMTGRLS